ncbi:amidase [Limosilactobacillus mucosae]|uniref:amidase n=1 Tax=Limosilactobacillus mucosae TaxID=97478 RepID=UPI003990E414
MNLLTLPAYRLAEMIRQHQLTSRELVEMALAKIQAENPTLNAVIHLRTEAALKEADQLADHGQPFLGVPLLLKGLGQRMKGEPDTNGSRLFKKVCANTTDNFVKALQNAGFIIIGQTNFPEFGYKNVTDAELFGPARNPWNAAFTPGGSSGGAGAAVAAGWVPIAAGNDGGGSIRIPASWCGTIGLKPTRGRMPVGPGSWRSWQGASINFAITRSVKDTALLLDTLQTVQSSAVFQTPLSKLFKPGTMELLPTPRLRIGWTTVSPVDTTVDEDATRAVLDAVDFLQQMGFDCQPYEDPIDGRSLIDSYYLMNEGETAAMFAQIEHSLKRPIGPDEIELVTWALWQTGKNISAAEYIAALNVWDKAAALHDQLHKKFDVLLTPTTATHPYRINEPQHTADFDEQLRHIDQLAPKEQQQLIYDQWLDSLSKTPFTQAANLTGEPAISLPTHIRKDGLPQGIQLIANKGRELDLLQLAALFEEHNQFKMLHPTIE